MKFTKNYLKENPSPGNVIFFTLVTILIFLSGIFFITNEKSPNTSELAFIENSKNSSYVGSIVPASCESNPVANHAGDCQCGITAGSCLVYSATGCTKTISWSVNWISGTANFTRLGTIVANGNSGSFTDSVPAAGETYSVRRPDGVAICSAVISGPPAPAVTLTAAPGTIDVGDSSVLTWTVVGANGCTASANDGSWNKAIPPNNDTEAVSPIVNTQYTLSCTGPGGTTNSSVTVYLPSGFIAVNPCVISVGNTSCNTSVAWEAYNFLGTPSVSQGATTFSNAPSSLGTARSISPTDNTFTLSDSGGIFTTSAVAGVTCAANSVWVPSLSICAPLPAITIVADPNVIRSGTSATLDIEINALYDLTCTYRDGGAPATFIHNGAPAVQPQNYLRNTRNLTSAQIVSISCEAVIDPLITGSGETRVNVVPTIQEI